MRTQEFLNKIQFQGQDEKFLINKKELRIIQKLQNNKFKNLNLLYLTLVQKEHSSEIIRVKICKQVKGLKFYYEFIKKLI